MSDIPATYHEWASFFEPDEMIAKHNEEQYEGPEATRCSACGEVIREYHDQHGCPNERRSGLERRITKIEHYLYSRPLSAMDKIASRPHFTNSGTTFVFRSGLRQPGPGVNRRRNTKDRRD